MAVSCPVIRTYCRKDAMERWPVNFITSSAGIPDKTALVANDLRAVWLLTNSHFAYFRTCIFPPLCSVIVTCCTIPAVRTISFTYLFSFWLDSRGMPLPWYLSIIACSFWLTGNVTACQRCPEYLYPFHRASIQLLFLRRILFSYSC